MNINTELSEQKRKVDFNTYDMSVKELISMVGDNIINIAPEYQRRFRWGDERQSTLIESIFLGIPIPPLFMATNIDGSWEVIDGVQRLSTIVRFAADLDSNARKLTKIESPLTLTGLKKLKSFNKHSFQNLPKSIQLDFQLKPIKITTLSDKSDKTVRFDLFERLNTGGIKLSDQEIRSCIYKGTFNDFLKELSKYPPFVKIVKIPQNSENDGTREELVLRFFAYLNQYESFDHSVVEFLNEYMQASSIKFNYDKNKTIFCEVFSQLSQLEYGIVKSKTRSQTSFILYEAVAVGAALAYKKKRQINTSKFYKWVKDKEFSKYITGATNSKNRVKARIEFCRDRFLE